MNSSAHVIRVSLFSLFVFFIAAEILFSIISLGAKSPKSVRVDRILDGCVINEDYQSVDGHKGESLSVYDDSRRVWHQTWVTNRGQLLIIEGNMQDGAMVLAGIDRTTPGKERHVRGIWKPVNGGVRETAVTSTDGGKTWKPWFDLMFRPHKYIAVRAKGLRFDRRYALLPKNLGEFYNFADNVVLLVGGRVVGKQETENLGR